MSGAPSGDLLAAMAAHGLEPGAIVWDGEVHRFHGPEKGQRNDDGWYRAFTDQRGAVFGDWARGIDATWQLANGRRDDFDAETWAKIQGDMERARQDREAAREQEHSAAALTCAERWEQASPADPDHLYLKAKGVTDPVGIRQDGDELLLPMKSARGAIASLQTIAPDGAKRFAKGGQVTGSRFVLGALELEADCTLYLVEGWATGWSLHEITGSTVVVAFTCSNLLPVAESLRQEYAHAIIIIAADNDQWTSGNPGVARATSAAESIGAQLTVPRFRSIEGNPTDFNDLRQREGDPAVVRCLLAAQRAVPSVAVTVGEVGKRKLPVAMGVGDLLAVEDPEEDWLVEGLIPAGGNVLLAGYPKTFKTMVLLELAVALASGTPFLGRYPVPARRRSGVVLMEDMPHRVRRRLQRLCLGRGVELGDLEGWLFTWCRPPLRLNDTTVCELADDAGALGLDLLAVDSWAYVAAGDSNSADEVTPQLLALSRARDQRPGLTVQLTHHARKTPGDSSSDRLTDLIRNSGAFGAWYDAGLVLARKNETSPVTVRGELRDHESPEPFAFNVEDEHPGSAENGRRSGGWLRLSASDETPQTVERRAAAEKLVPMVREHLASRPGGVSRTGLREVPGTHADVEAAFRILEGRGEAIFRPSPGSGLPANYALHTNPAEPCRNHAAARSEKDPAEPAADAPVRGGAGGQGSEAGRTTWKQDAAPARSEHATAVDDLLDVGAQK